MKFDVVKFKSGNHDEESGLKVPLVENIEGDQLDSNDAIIAL